eukprot:6486004-Amphidinium_carterae.1
MLDTPDLLRQQRSDAFAFWQERATALREQSLAELRALDDVYLRNLYIRGDQLGQFLHIALWREMADAAAVVDKSYVAAMLNGLPIIGCIDKSCRWPPLSHTAPAVSEGDRKKGVTEYSAELWKAALQDVEEGSCIGPLFSEVDVSMLTGTDRWIPTERFPVVQRNKVRGVDSATVNLINGATAVVEKLILPNIDACIGLLRKLSSQSPGKALAGWMLDEKKAYRQ